MLRLFTRKTKQSKSDLPYDVVESNSGAVLFAVWRNHPRRNGRATFRFSVGRRRGKIVNSIEAKDLLDFPEVIEQLADFFAARAETPKPLKAKLLDVAQLMAHVQNVRAAVAQRQKSNGSGERPPR